jgi:hypothetical protein
MLNARSISRLRKIDWDFTGTQSESLFSAIHWYPCRFVSQIPAALIGTLSDRGELVLDPFVGSGTTLFEAQRLGRASIGIDINPIACLAAKAKTLSITSGTVSKWVESLEHDVRDLLSESLLFRKESGIPDNAPAAVQQNKWYTRRVAGNLTALWNLIESERGQKRTLGQAAFSAILLRVCRETRHWGYVCDNTTPKSNYEGDVEAEFTTMLDRLDAAYQERDRELLERFGGELEIPSAEVHCEDSRKALKEIALQSVDLVVTSPPYLGVSDYVKAQRLSMEWCGVEIEEYRRKEIGARSKRHRLKSQDDYLHEIAEVFEGVHRCLRPGAACVIVVGESSARTPYIAKLMKSIEDKGFETVHTAKRRVPAQRRLAPSILQEQIIILRAIG